MKSLGELPSNHAESVMKAIRRNTETHWSTPMKSPLDPQEGYTRPIWKHVGRPTMKPIEDPSGSPLGIAHGNTHRN